MRRGLMLVLWFVVSCGEAGSGGSSIMGAAGSDDAAVESSEATGSSNGVTSSGVMGLVPLDFETAKSFDNVYEITFEQNGCDPDPDADPTQPVRPFLTLSAVDWAAEALERFGEVRPEEYSVGGMLCDSLSNCVQAQGVASPARWQFPLMQGPDRIASVGGTYYADGGLCMDHGNASIQTVTRQGDEIETEHRWFRLPNRVADANGECPEITQDEVLALVPGSECLSLELTRARFLSTREEAADAVAASN